MAYARLDDIFPEHPKVAALTDRAFRAHVRGICYSAKVLSDGFVPFAIARGWGDKPVSELVLAGVWDPAPGGFTIHDYLDFNPSRRQVKAKRAADSKRKRGGVGAESDATPRARSRTPLPSPPPVVGVDSEPDTPTAVGNRGEAAPEENSNGHKPFHLADVVNLNLVVTMQDRYGRRAAWKGVTPGLLTALVLGSEDRNIRAYGARAVNAAIDDLYENAAKVPNPAGYLRERAESHAAPLPDSSSSKVTR